MSHFTFHNAAIADALPAITEHIFFEVEQFGVFNIDRRVTTEGLVTYYRDRLAFIQFFIAALQNTAGLEFSHDSHIPFIYNVLPSVWSEDLPLAGYTNSVSPKPAMVLSTLVSNWNLQISSLLSG